MSDSPATRARRLKSLVVLVVTVSYALLASPLFSARCAPARALSLELQSETDARFDVLVRNDFFAGMTGDGARLDRGMKFCEAILARNPQHAEALVWHGGGLLARAARAYTKGDSALGDKLWEQGLEEMNRAVAFEPNNMGVKIGRSATLIGLAQSGWDASDAKAKALLESALADYEKVYRAQRPTFHQLGSHSRGELLFGLASGWSLIGEQKKAKAYLRLIVKACQGTVYEAEARKWLATEPLPVVQHDCTGCHVSSSH